VICPSELADSGADVLKAGYSDPTGPMKMLLDAVSTVVEDLPVQRLRGWTRGSLLSILDQRRRIRVGFCKSMLGKRAGNNKDQ
jgi:hypothetical protein